MLGPGYQPVLAFKGSAGEVRQVDGRLRDTTGEDFAANNFPQSVGLKTDYYDRAMDLAVTLTKASFTFEITGHSLSGGMASAASAVTGVKATTFNAPGLHPQTARRFAQENPGTQLFDVKDRITAYVVQGELLNDGVQDNFSRLDVVRRELLGGTLKEVSELLHELPQGRALLQQQLNKHVPRHAHSTVNAFVQTLAEGNTRQLLKDLPLAAGAVQPLLLPKTHAKPNDPSAITDRTRAMSLQELTQIATPVLITLRSMSAAAHAGHEVGEVAAASGRVIAAGMDKAGDAMQATRSLAGAASAIRHRVAGEGARRVVAVTGEGMADAREAIGQVSAGIDHAQGNAQQTAGRWGAGLLRSAASLLPSTKAQAWLGERADALEGAGERAHRANQAQAAQARSEARTDAAAIRDQAEIVTLETVRVTVTLAEARSRAWQQGGEQANRNTDAVAQAYAKVTGQMPVAYAGAAAASVGGATAVLQGYPMLASMAALKDNAVAAGGEAFQRHLMTETMVPSLDARIQQLEGAAKRQLQGIPEATQQSPADRSAEKAADPRAAAHPSHVLHQDVQQLVDGLYAKAGLPLPDQHLQQFSACMLLKCQEHNMPHVGAMTYVGDASGGKLVSHEISAQHFPPHNAFVDVQAALQTQPHDSYRQLNQLLQQQEIAAQLERDQQAKRESERLQNPGPQAPGAVMG